MFGCLGVWVGRLLELTRDLGVCACARVRVCACARVRVASSARARRSRGHDFVLESSTAAPSYASALTYCEVLTLSYDDLQSVLEADEYEAERRMIRHAVVW